MFACWTINQGVDGSYLSGQRDALIFMLRLSSQSLLKGTALICLFLLFVSSLLNHELHLILVCFSFSSLWCSMVYWLVCQTVNREDRVQSPAQPVPLGNSAMMSTPTIHCFWEDEKVEWTNHLPSNAEILKMKSITLHTCGCLRASCRSRSFFLFLHFCLCSSQVAIVMWRKLLNQQENTMLSSFHLEVRSDFQLIMKLILYCIILLLIYGALVMIAK